MNPIDSILAELQRELQKLYGDQFVALVLYGSYARGEAHEDSDIDVAMILKSYERAPLELKRTSEIAARLSLDYDSLVALIPLREREWREKKSFFMNNLRRDGVLIR